MKIKVKDLDINCIQYTKANTYQNDIVLLHGWGQNIAMMQPLGDYLCKKNRVTIIDLPGFGESSEPTKSYILEDYVEVLEIIFKKLNIKKPIMIGHSFGGRLAIKYSYNHAIKKLVLFGSPCIRKETKPSLKVRIYKKLNSYNSLKKLGELAKNYIGSRDYKAATPIMRATLVNVVNEDLSKYAMQIEEETLLIWGDNDQEAPLEDAKELVDIMPDAALITLPGTHYAYLENLTSVLRILNKFI